jgi:hypothetical protein
LWGIIKFNWSHHITLCHTFITTSQCKNRCNIVSSLLPHNTQFFDASAFKNSSGKLSFPLSEYDQVTKSKQMSTPLTQLGFSKVNQTLALHNGYSIINQKQPLKNFVADRINRKCTVYRCSNKKILFRQGVMNSINF